MISRLLLPSAVRLATYSCVRRSRRILARHTMYSARLASLLPPRLRRCLTTLPKDASTGETPQRLAKEASLFNLLGLSPATIRSVAALSVPMPGKESSSGAACATSRSRCASRSAISSERASWRRATERSANLVAACTSLGPSPRRKRAATETSSFVESPRKRWRSSSGAVTRKPWSWLAACVLALTAEWWAARRALIISTMPSALLGTPEASPAKTARAARSASEGSDLLTLLRELRRRCFGRSTSSTSIPLALRWRASLRLHSCWYLLPRRTSRSRSPPPSGEAFRNPSRSLARSTRLSFSAQMVYGHGHV